MQFTPLLMIITLSIALPLGAATKESFAPDLESLSKYECPEWFRDAKFGIWAHWGPQCEPESGDWYARNMYLPDKPHYKEHIARYGHPSEVGFKEIIRDWKAEKFDPDALVEFYRKSGARYFVAMANHHDNFDLWDSKHQAWNAAKIGPKRDLIAGWAAAAKKAGLRFGVSVHAARTWRWWEVTRNADKEGPFAGVRYDGRLTKADGTGRWWEGLDPQDLYEQRHDIGGPPDQAYVDRFFRRVDQLVTDYTPVLLFFDDAVLPLYKDAPTEALTMVADFYNSSIRRHGRNEAVLATKALDEQQRKAFLYDIERGKASEILPQPWQTDTCIGHWHYDRAVYDRNEYKSAETVIAMLVDIVSKNGNLLLSIPLRRDGQPDEKEMEIVRGIGAWLERHGEAIYGTRPWTTFGEGPAMQVREAGKFGGDKDTFSGKWTAEDIRFTQSKDGQTLFALVLGRAEDGKVTVRSLASGDKGWPDEIGSVSLLGGGKLAFSRDGAGLHVTLPQDLSGEGAFALKIQP